MQIVQALRGRQALVSPWRHYFPGVNLDTISDEEFAMLSEEALWHIPKWEERI